MEKSAIEYIRAHESDPIMDGLELRLFLVEHGINQRHAAKVCGVHERTMRRYIAGRTSIKSYQQAMLRYSVSR